MNLSNPKNSSNSDFGSVVIILISYMNRHVLAEIPILWPIIRSIGIKYKEGPLCGRPVMVVIVVIMSIEQAREKGPHGWAMGRLMLLDRGSGLPKLTGEG